MYNVVCIFLISAGAATAMSQAAVIMAVSIIIMPESMAANRAMNMVPVLNSGSADRAGAGIIGAGGGGAVHAGGCGAKWRSSGSDAAGVQRGRREHHTSVSGLIMREASEGRSYGPSALPLRAI